MTLELALAKIKMLEEANQKLSSFVNFFLNIGPAANEYQKLLAKENEQQRSK